MQVSPTRFAVPVEWDGDGSVAREVCRRLVAISAANLGDLIAAETTVELDIPVTPTFGRLRGAGSLGIGLDVDWLVDSSMSPADPLERVGAG